MLRRYDTAVLELLKLSFDGKEVPIIFATPRREYADPGELRTELNSNNSPQFGGKDGALPSMALQRLDWQQSQQRANWARHRKLKWSDDLNQVTQAQHPLAYDILYQLDIWTKYREDANFIVGATMAKFPRMYRSAVADFGHPWGEKKIFLKSENVSDTTNVDPGDADREIRMTVSFTLEAWLPLGYTDVRTVRKTVMAVDVYWIDNNRGRDQRLYKETVEES